MLALFLKQNLINFNKQVAKQGPRLKQSLKPNNWLLPIFNMFNNF